MKIHSVNNVAFRGPLDGMVTSALRTCDMNEMVNAVGTDIGTMVIPRAWYDTKYRNKYAGAETFFREASGTFINCLSAGIFAMGISKMISHRIDPSIKINSDSWYSADSLRTLKAAWNKTQNIDDYLAFSLDHISGRDGHKDNYFKDIEWDKVNWVDEDRWNKYKWDNPKYTGIHERVKTKEGVINTLKELIQDDKITKDDKKKVFSILDKRITNALGTERYTKLKVDTYKLSERLEYILRDVYDMGKDVLNNKSPEEIEKTIKKIKKVNNIKACGAITLSCALGLTNQVLNRKITEKRTGIKGFVGNVDFTTGGGEQKKDKFLMAKKLGASAIMILLVFKTMGVKSVKEFMKKLQFTGPVTSGNAIKTVYGSTIVGRFLAADNETELRESMTRDYLGFLNWLVFGGFFAKGVANVLDKKGDVLFNYKKEGKGVAHWLNDIGLKTHNELASKGEKYLKKHLWKLDLAHASGLAYTAISLGILLPMLNEKVTKHNAKKQGKLPQKTA